MNWQSFYVLLSILPCIILVWLAWLGWRRRQTAGAPAFIALVIAVALWSLFHALKLSSPNETTAIFWEKMKYFGIVSMPVAWLAFASQYTGADRWLNPRTFTMIALFPALTLAIVWTNPQHEWMWTSFRLDETGNAPQLLTTEGIWFAPYILYSYGLILSGTIMLVRFAIGSPEHQRKQTIAIIAVVGIGLIGNLISVLDINPINSLDLTPLLFTASGLVMALALLRFDLLDIVPVAYYSVFEHLMDGAIVVDSGNVILDANPAVCKPFGYDHPSMVMGKQLEQAFVDLPDRVSPASAVPGTTTVIQRGDQYFEIRVSPLKNPHQRLKGRVLLFHDITERKLDEQVIRQSEERYRSLANNVPIGIYRTTTEGHLIDANPTLAKILGYSSVSHLLMNATQLDYFNRSERLKQIEQVKNAGGVTQTELQFKTQDGRDIWVRDRTYVALNADDTLASISGTIEDITELRSETDERIKRVEQLSILQQIYEEISLTLNIDDVLSVSLDAAIRLSGAHAGFMALSDGEDMTVAKVIGPYPDSLSTFILGPDSGIVGRVMVNQESEYITDVANDPDYLPYLDDTKAKMVIPLISQEYLLGLLNLETSKPERFSLEVFRFMQILGSQIVFAVDNARLYNRGQIQLEELQTLYDQVRELEHLKTDMIRIAAHDLKNPLVALDGHIQLLQYDEEQFEEEHRRYFKTMRRSTDRMMDMIDNILSLERIEQMAKKQDAPKRGVDILHQVVRAIEEFRPLAIEKSQAINLDIDDLPDPDTLVVSGDDAQIYEAVTNLINNAIKYTPDQGIIAVTLRIENSHVAFTVKDTGYGIPEEKQKDLFRPFYRVKSRETRKISGTGLGLHLVRNIIRRHKGQMIFQSVYGEGSTFGFTLPYPTNQDKAEENAERRKSDINLFD